LFGAHGGDAQQQALGTIYQMVQRQAAMLSYIEIFYLMAGGVLLIVPLALLLPKNDPRAKGDAAAAAH
jgi:hypothetical protein